MMEKTTDKIVPPVGVEQFTDRFATTVSLLANPLFVAIPVFLLIALHTAPDPILGLLWWAIIVGGMSLVPLVFIARGVRTGRYSDRHVSLREQRRGPLLFGMGCVVSVFLLLLLAHASRPLLATMTAVLVTMSIATVITVWGKWKISFHLVGIAGTVVALGLILDPLSFLLAPLVILTAWARWRVQAHTVLQACAGTVLAVVMTLLVFWLFGLF